MKTITKYEANDGSEWNSEKEATQRDECIYGCDAIMAMIDPRPENDGCAFANGGGFLQHSEEKVKAVRMALLDLITKECSHRWVEESRNMEVHPSYVARILDDADNGPLSKAWHRLYCTDSQFREWGQPYYAMNPDKGEQKQLN